MSREMTSFTSNLLVTCWPHFQRVFMCPVAPVAHPHIAIQRIGLQKASMLQSERYSRHKNLRSRSCSDEDEQERKEVQAGDVPTVSIHRFLFIGQALFTTARHIKQIVHTNHTYPGKLSPKLSWRMPWLTLMRVLSGATCIAKLILRLD